MPYSQTQSAGELEHGQEYKIIKRDLIRLLILNSFYFALLLALYFANQKSQFLDNWFAVAFQL